MLNTTNKKLKRTPTILMSIAFLFICNCLNAHTSKYRIMFGDNPSTDITIGFDATFTTNKPVIYYDVNPININNLQSYASKTPDEVISYHGMVNCFVRLTNLSPGQTYYFVIKDNFGKSEMYNFETISDTNSTKLSIVAGGDSRNNGLVRRVANRIVSKLNAHAIVFNGDLVDDSHSPLDWQEWLDDWQLTINSNNRLTPIIPARGNHESNDDMLINFFDCEPNIIYTKTLGNNLLQVYTLNSEKSISYASTQTTWLESQLINSQSIWKFAQYHKPTRPHTRQKKEGAMQYAYWANLFYKYGMDVVLEGDSHTAKTTWPIIPCSGGFGCDEGFKRDDNNGTVYIGEGCYSAPLRAANDTKIWTRDSGRFDQFKIIYVDKHKMEIRTVKYDANTNINAIEELNTANRFEIPGNLEVWNPTNGDVVTLYKSTANMPTCELLAPLDNKMFFSPNEICLSANATGTNQIKEVQFYANGTLIETDYNAPYQLNWQPHSNGLYIISAIAKDVNDLSSNINFSFITVEGINNIIHTASIDIPSDEYSEYTNNIINYDNHKIEVCKAGIELQGLRFKSINIPKNAIIERAYITFVANRGYLDTANATISCEKSANALSFKVDRGNITNRAKTGNSTNWDISSWALSTAYTTPDLSMLIQELVELKEWSIESPIVFLIKGNYGNRRAKSFTSVNLVGNKTHAPELTVEFSVPECPDNLMVSLGELKGAFKAKESIGFENGVIIYEGAFEICDN